MHRRLLLGLLAGLLLPGVAAAEDAPVARFSEVTYAAPGVEFPEEGNFRNPILPGFHPDPSVVKVDGDFYLVTSTFGWFPGIPVFHSTDLVNWELVSHAIERPGQLDFSGLNIVTDGVYAPAITYHDGTYYIFNTCVRCGDNFYVTAEDPAGPWSDPIWVDFGGIDPSLFVDDDGSAWVVNNDAPEGGSQYEGHRALWIQRIDLETGKMFGPRTQIVDGGVHIEDQPIWAEGPHIYKIDGWYYLLAAEGGTADQHSQTIYRSRNVDGPYEAGPVNPILTQRDMPRPRENPVEATGHADFIQLDDGSWWGVFLAVRPFEGQESLLGRETWLLPVEWRDGWPIFLDEGVPVPWELPKPDLPQGSKSVVLPFWTEDFAGEGLSGEWLTMRGPPGDWLALESGDLLLSAGADRASDKGQPHAVMRRMRHPDAVWMTTVSFTPEQQGDFAGLLAFAHEDHYLAFGIGDEGEGPEIVVRKRSSAEADEVVVKRYKLENVPDKVTLLLKIEDGQAIPGWYVSADTNSSYLDMVFDISDMASIHSGLFTGVTVGPYAVRGGE
jgi:alpha-N-arabinofuranosidase